MLKGRRLKTEKGQFKPRRKKMLDLPTNLPTQRQLSCDPRVTDGNDFDPVRVD